jgi:hypothetical protein
VNIFVALSRLGGSEKEMKFEQIINYRGVAGVCVSAFPMPICYEINKSLNMNRPQKEARSGVWKTIGNGTRVSRLSGIRLFSRNFGPEMESDREFRAPQTLSVLANFFSFPILTNLSGEIAQIFAAFVSLPPLLGRFFSPINRSAKASKHLRFVVRSARH